MQGARIFQLLIYFTKITVRQATLSKLWDQGRKHIPYACVSLVLDAIQVRVSIKTMALKMEQQNT